MMGRALDAYKRLNPEHVSRPEYEAEQAAWCSGFIAALTECGMRTCEHCGGFGKIHDMNTKSVLTCAECDGSGHAMSESVASLVHRLRAQRRRIDVWIDRVSESGGVAPTRQEILDADDASEAAQLIEDLQRGTHRV